MYTNLYTNEIFISALSGGFVDKISLILAGLQVIKLVFDCYPNICAKPQVKIQISKIGFFHEWSAVNSPRTWFLGLLTQFGVIW